MKNTNKIEGRGPVRLPSGGFIQIIIAIIVIVLILTFFKVNIRGLVESDAGKTNFGYIWELITHAWTWFWNWVMENGDKLKAWLEHFTQ